MKWKLGLYRGYIIFNNRAELYAIWQPLVSATTGHIYTDSKYCNDGCKLLQQQGWIEQSWSKASNYGLWFKVWCALRHDPHRWTIHKVSSHHFLGDAISTFDAWCIVHNNAADEQAKKANWARDELFLLNYRARVSHTNSRTPLGSKSPVCSSRLQWCQITANRLWLPVAIS